MFALLKWANQQGWAILLMLALAYAPSPAHAQTSTNSPVPTFVWPGMKKQATFLVPYDYPLEQFQFIMPKGAPVGSFKVDVQEKTSSYRTINVTIRSQKDLVEGFFFHNRRVECETPYHEMGGSFDLARGYVANKGGIYFAPSDWIDLHHNTDIDLYRVPLSNNQMMVSPIASGTLLARTGIDGRNVDQVQNLQVGGGAGVHFKMRESPLRIVNLSDLVVTGGALEQLANNNGTRVTPYLQVRAKLRIQTRRKR